MRVVFMGSPEFSVAALEALVQAGHEIITVYSQPPRPKGRGQAVEKTPVHVAAEKMGLLVRTPATFKNEEAVKEFQALDADVAVVVAYGLLLRKPILEAPRYGCVNIHGSVLPRWRGAAPIHRAIEAGDTETGITTMQMDVGLDTGPMLLIEKTPITAADTYQTVHDRLSKIGAELIVKTLAELQQIPPQIQPEEGVTYAHKITKEESIIDWAQPAEVIERKIRAFSVWPGMWTDYKGERLRIHEAQRVDRQGKPGMILEKPFVIACGEKALSVMTIQRAGKNKQSIEEFSHGFDVMVGDVL